MIGIIELLRSLPAIIAFLLELKKLWDQHIQIADRQAKITELKDAIKEAREKKDTSKVEQLLRDISSKPS